MVVVFMMLGGVPGAIARHAAAVNQSLRRLALAGAAAATGRLGFRWFLHGGFLSNPEDV
jgi:hypothetical protein